MSAIAMNNPRFLVTLLILIPASRRSTSSPASYKPQLPLPAGGRAELDKTHVSRHQPFQEASAYQRVNCATHGRLVAVASQRLRQRAQVEYVAAGRSGQRLPDP